ncbi:autophagy-related protein 2 homolog A [Trichogramma pretiosum]|uniref:autophagy-related protein 2 homolog A n=1 Tax=Trichogramma pretiosum TaxID=7493 RepID=UPI0006C9679B|nr:autophagy-related protein 2 homolog A [Trichogramma pretiosum]
MSWLGYLPWSEGIKKRACRYLLQRYLGQFLEEKLTLDQLTVDLYNGTGRVTNVSLDVQALNELGEQQHLPIEFVDGFVAEMSVSIPWSALLSEASYIEVTGLRMTVQPRQRTDDGTSMFESMWSSMTSSMQLAQECLQQDSNTAGNSQPLEGIETFAQTIDSILSKVKIRFLDTVIRLEHVPLDSATGVAMEIRIQNLEYSDEAGSDPSPNVALDSNQSAKGYVVSAFSTKRFYLEGVTFHADEFPSRARTFSKSVMTTSRGSTPDSKTSDGQFSSAQISPTQNMQTPPDKNIVNNLNESNPIIFAKLSGRQEIKLKLKRGEGVLGPKVELIVTLGSLTMFMSPRQVHLLLELMQGLASPDMEDISNVAPRPVCTEKPMVNSDFNRVERELFSQINPAQSLKTLDLRNTQGWSTASLDDSDNEDEFLPMRMHNTSASSNMNNSITSNNTSMDGSIMTSSFSSKSSINNSHRQHKYRHTVDSDPSAETSQFHVRVSSIAVVLLHENILTTGMEGYGPTKASIKMMTSKAEEFFQKIHKFTASGYGNKDFERASKLFADACQLSHLRFLAAPLVLECSEKKTSQFCTTSGGLTLASLEIVECLIEASNSNNSINATFIELLSFLRESTPNSAFLNKTDFEMRFKYSMRAVRQGQITKYSNPRTEFDITLKPCQCELDISIIDRISMLLNPEPICVSSPASTVARGNINQQTLFYQAVESPLPDSRTDIKVNASKCIIILRFPIPDLRPRYDRVPWWKRSIRPDYMTLHLTDAKAQTLFESRKPYLSRLEIQCRRVLVTYTEADSDVPLEIAKASSDKCERADGSLQNEDEGFGWPRIVVSIFPQHVGGPLEDSSEGELDSSLDDTLENAPRHQPSPFSSKKVIHESDTPHSRPQNQHDKDSSEQKESEELIIPGNRQEMNEFIEEGTRNVRIQLEIGLPCASVQIPSKHLYELIYNRLNTDLLLWEPSAPKRKSALPTDTNASLDIASTLLQESVYPKFSMCKSGIQYDSDSDSEEDGIFQSTTSRVTNKHRHNRLMKNGQSKVSITLTINQGLFTMFTPVRDSMQNVIPGQQGELVIRIEDATMFSVSSYKGDENLGYVCILGKEVTLYHCGINTIPSQAPPLRSINSIIPKHCHRTIYRSEPGANIAVNAIEKDMLSVAIKIQSAHETHRVKTFRVAIGISQATLSHRVCLSQTFWFTQLTDCLDVMDHPVSGYIPPGVLTELHVHLWECTIDYRPIHLPLRSMVTIGSFSVSSNIAAQTNTSTLRFIAEDLALFISDKMGKLVDLRRDYVCVMDLGLFELSLRLNEKMCGGAPRVDLRASNDVLHVRTCSDSGRALMQLLTYFASDGDLAPSTGNEESTTVPSSEDGESLLGDESINLLSKSQIERVNSLMEEAMEDTVKGTTEKPDQKSPKRNDQVEVFFFPDESNPAVSDTFKKSSTTSKGFSSPSLDDHHLLDFDDGDEDFCILGEEAGVGIMPRHGVPEVRLLSQESLRIVDNHFSIPLGKKDLLQAPKNFPPASLRYTLCEMTLVWHIYGGKDFGDTQPVAKKHITINDNSTYYSNCSQARSRSAIESVGYSSSSPNRVRFGSMPNSPNNRQVKNGPLDWQELGGPHRRLDVLMEFQLNKIRFQHELYPDNTREASCQILLISEIEIRDRLASSHINKFLYQYSSETKPRQSHANMFAMKAIHIRPDPKQSAQECCLKLSLLPLRLNIDQDSLLFLINFFTELSNGIKPNTETMGNNVPVSPGSKQGTPTHHPPVMSVNEEEDDFDTKNTINISQNANIDQNLMILLEDELTIKENKSSAKTINETQESGQPVYFRKITFAPEVLVRLDYHGKRVDLTHGPLAGLLMGLGQLNCSELRLKRLTNRQGILGFDKLMSYLLSEWTQDIKKNQLPSLLGGVGPMHSLVQLFQGIRDLFWLPIEQYQKDGRIVRGLQRGANSFTTSTAMAALELTSRLVHAIQSTAETAYDMVSPGPSVRSIKTKGQRGRRKRYSQPLDIREGVANAYILVKEGLGETANQLVRVASEEHEQKGVSGAVGGVLRQIPPTVVKPIILATEATSNVLGGMRSQLVPDARHEAAQKWRQDCHDVN